MAEAARREDGPDCETLHGLVVAVHRTAHKMLYRQQLARMFLMGDIAMVQAAVDADRERRKGVEGPDIGPEGAD